MGSRSVRAWVTLAVLLLGGCSSCGAPQLLVDGELPYARCAARPAPPMRTPEGEELAAEGRTLRLPLRLPLDVEVARSAVGRPPQGDPDAGVVLWLGGLGDDVEAARAGLAELADGGRWVLFLAGGEDRLPTLEATFAEPQDGVIDLTPFAALAIGDAEVAVLGGAPPRYARGADGCGVSPEDRTARATNGPWLSWARPEDLPEALFAWPRAEAAPRVRPAGGPEVRLRDGRRIAPGFTALRLTATGWVRPSD
jgi:hypothetical protein